MCGHAAIKRRRGHDDYVASELSVLIIIVAMAFPVFVLPIFPIGTCLLAHTRHIIQLQLPQLGPQLVCMLADGIVAGCVDVTLMNFETHIGNVQNLRICDSCGIT